MRVENRVSKEPYAIKIIDRTRASHMCASELHVLRRVRHPNIIKLVEVFEESLKLYLVIELATGGELCERVISKGSFSEPVCNIFIYLLLLFQFLINAKVTYQFLNLFVPCFYYFNGHWAYFLHIHTTFFLIIFYHKAV